MINQKPTITIHELSMSHTHVHASLLINGLHCEGVFRYEPRSTDKQGRLVFHKFVNVYHPSQGEQNQIGLDRFAEMLTSIIQRFGGAGW